MSSNEDKDGKKDLMYMYMLLGDTKEEAEKRANQLIKETKQRLKVV